MTTIPATVSPPHAGFAYQRPEDLPVGRLALADGTVFEGRAFGAGVSQPAHLADGEVVFNTALTGYQESLTDPSYTGQILVQTTPLIGNTGINPDDQESARVQVAGLVVRELTRTPSNYRATERLDAWLARHGVMGLAGVDTRALTRILRSRGAIGGVLSAAPTDGEHAVSDAELVDRAIALPSMAGQNLVPGVGCRTDATWSETLGAWAPATEGADGRRRRVLAIDCGAKRNILRNLAQRGCEVTVIPWDTAPDEILRRFEAGGFDGLFVSNGPGDPAAVEQLIATLRQIAGADTARGPIPTFGICLGHQLLALACGATTFKLPFGHRGTNQPVHDVEHGRIEITSQNHGFAVDPASLDAVGGVATHVHLNDGTLAGFRLRERPVFAVQYHPEASPGPHDAAHLFDRFVASMRHASATPAMDAG